MCLYDNFYEKDRLLVLGQILRPKAISNFVWPFFWYALDVSILARQPKKLLSARLLHSRLPCLSKFLSAELHNKVLLFFRKFTTENETVV